MGLYIRSPLRSNLVIDEILSAMLLLLNQVEIALPHPVDAAATATGSAGAVITAQVSLGSAAAVKEEVINGSDVAATVTESVAAAAGDDNEIEDGGESALDSTCSSCCTYTKYL